MAADNEWIKDKLKFVLHSSENSFTLEVVQLVTKEIWSTSEINEKGADTLTSGLFDTPVTVLKQMVKDALGGTKPEVKYKLSFENDNSVLKLAIGVTFYVETKTFNLILQKKEMNETWRLEQIILDLRSELEAVQKTLESHENNFALMNQKFQDLDRKFQQSLDAKVVELNKTIKQSAKNLFVNWRGDMITHNNTSHTPQNDPQKLSFMNSGTASVIAWDGKTSGWIQFTFDNPLNCVATRFANGCGTWDIEYSDNNTSWTKVGTFKYGVDAMCSWDSVGPHKYWRYNLIQNTGSPYYYGYEWYYC